MKKLILLMPIFLLLFVSSASALDYRDYPDGISTKATDWALNLRDIKENASCPSGVTSTGTCTGAIASGDTTASLYLNTGAATILLTNTTPQDISCMFSFMTTGSPTESRFSFEDGEGSYVIRIGLYGTALKYNHEGSMIDSTLDLAANDWARAKFDWNDTTNFYDVCFNETNCYYTKRYFSTSTTGDRFLIRDPINFYVKYIICWDWTLHGHTPPMDIPPTNNLIITVQDNFDYSLINATVTITNSTFTNTSNTTNGIITFYDINGLYDITINATNYFNIIYSDWNASIDITANLTYYKARFQANEMFKRTPDNATIQNFTLRFYNLNISSIEINASTTTGNITVELAWNQSYNVTIDPPTYQIKHLLVNTSNENDYIQNTIIYFYLENSFYFTFKEEETKTIIENVSLELISNDFSGNYTTQNGTLGINLLIPEFYTIRYDAVGYGERFYYHSLTNRSHSNIILYLIDGINVTAIVLDGSNKPLEDTYIKVLRYSVDDNAYTIREIAKTNFEGKTLLHLKLNTEFYKFIIEYPFGIVKKVTSPTYIYETTLSFQIIIGTAAGANFFNSQGVSYDLSFNNATNNMKFTYSDSGSAVTQGCLEIYQNTLRGSTFYNSTCVIDATASILLGITNTSGSSYEAKGFVYLGDTKYYLTSLTHTFDEAKFAGNLGMLMIIFMMIVFAFIGVWSMSVALILTPLPLFFGSIMNLIDFSIQLAIGLEIVCIIVAIVISRKNA